MGSKVRARVKLGTLQTQREVWLVMEASAVYRMTAEPFLGTGDYSIPPLIHTLRATSRFRSVAEIRRSVKVSHVYRKVSLTSQVRSVTVAEWECLAWRNGFGPSLPAQFRECEQTSVTFTSLRVFACNECCLFLSSKVDEKLVELERKCEELCDMSNKECSDSLWKETWGYIAQGFKNFVLFLVFIEHFEVTTILLSPNF
jgi:hypothetical protein